MRQFLFVVVMVAVAFLGGATVNGPAFRWVQARLLDYMGLKDGGEIVSVDLPHPPVDASDSRRPLSSTAVADVDAATAVPSNSSNPRRDQATISTGSLNSPSHSVRSPGRPLDDHTQQGKSDKSRAPAAESSASHRPPAKHVSPPLPVPAAVPEPAAPQLAGESGDLNGTPSASNKPQKSSQTLNLPASAQDGDSQSALPAPLDASIGPALLASLSPSPSAQMGPESQTGSSAIPLETAPRNSSPTPSSPSPSVSITSTSAASTPDPASDWASLRRKMQVLGVTRYTIEGELAGHVTFSCLIPLAGRQAVTQRFEAEGEDELHAARAAIRRVALWRAAQSTAPPAPVPAR